MEETLLSLPSVRNHNLQVRALIWNWLIHRNDQTRNFIMLTFGSKLPGSNKKLCNAYHWSKLLKLTFDEWSHWNDQMRNFIMLTIGSKLEGKLGIFAARLSNSNWKKRLACAFITKFILYWGSGSIWH